MPQAETYLQAELKRGMIGHTSVITKSWHELWRLVEEIATRAHHEIISTGGSVAEANEAYKKILSWIKPEAL